MAVEPVGVTLAVVGLLKPAFDACRDIYKGYKLTQSFGEDYDIARRDYEFQVARLEAISQRKLGFLKAKLEPWDRSHPITQQTTSKLVVLKAHFETCSRLFGKYYDLEIQAEEEGDSSLPAEDQPAQEDVRSNSSSTLVFEAFLPSPESSQRHAVPIQPPPTTSPSPSKRSFPPLNWSILKKKKTKRGTLSQVPLQVLSVASLAASPGRSPSTSPNDSGTSSLRSAQNRAHPPASNPLTSMSPSILNAQPIATIDRQRDAHSRTLKLSNKFLRRVVWAADDRKLLLSEIKEIRDCNTDLEDLLRYREPRDAGQILDLDSALPLMIQNVSRIQQALKRLHEALISVNTAFENDPMRISIKLAADCDEIAQHMSQEDNLNFRENSYIFVLQVHRSHDKESVAIEILAETTQSPAPSQASSLGPQQGKSEVPPRLSDLHEALRYVDIGVRDNAFDVLGSISRSGSSWDQHHLFYDTQSGWYCTQTLDNVIETRDFREKLNPIQRAQLATLLSITHLYFANVRLNCVEPQPSHFVFYTTTGEPPKWNEFEPFVLNPYLSFGFGTRKPTRNPGAYSGIAKWKKSNSIVELGLLLHQISSCIKLNYGEGSEGLRRAKEEALRTIHAVDQGSGGKFAEVVEMCLNWNKSAFTAMSDEECDVIQRVVGWLMGFEEKLGS